MHTELARAKVNLALHVTGVTDAGYHELDSLVVFADVGDVLHFQSAGDLSLEITGPFGDGLSAGPDNLILRAAALMGSPDVKITLEKNLPVASGIGGGSADAAATLRGLAVFNGLPLPSPEDQLVLGADVPVCVRQETCRMQGIGEDITQLDLTDRFHAVLINPGVGVSTAAVFSGLATKHNPAMDLEDISIAALRQLRNDLEAPAVEIAPTISTVLEALKVSGACIARMSGSGATCFGIFDSAEDAFNAAKSLSAAHPSWWVQPCQLG